MGEIYLNNYLIELILLRFFKHPDYCGAKEIGRKLLTVGYCVTTTDKIWNGGVGNFIKSEEFTDGVDLFKLTLNKEFFKSHMLNEFLYDELSVIKDEQLKLQEKFESVIQLKNSINNN